MTTSPLPKSRAASMRRGLEQGGKRRTLEDANGGGEVVDPPGGLESSNDDDGRRDEIVGEGVVQVALRGGRSVCDVATAGHAPRLESCRVWGRLLRYLKLKDILDCVEFLLESVVDSRSANETAGILPR